MAERFFIYLVNISAKIAGEHGIDADDIGQAYCEALGTLRELRSQGHLVFDQSEWRLEIRNSVGELVQSYDIPDYA
ncbi:hypothetical protein VQ03_25475 [Methylobacterium tarhaniae]|uniref:DUF6894 domain-containing protein n=1 Tax=Methylobacterium tarhaniae TaxID=1187852 RepID=A0A0J6SIJ1_9HYPH|nr:hypothetical protein [Methylobacterium tarhaniae]KMO33198.1 hypothetical protein VQ03_25475 [Methylobacterium tarhaniae]